MKLFLDLNYHFFPKRKLNQIIDKYYANFGYLFYLKNKFNVISLLQSSFNETQTNKTLKIITYKGKALHRIDYPYKFHKKIKEINPDYILIHGLRYGLLSFFLKKKLPKTIILVQVHGFADSPSGFKKTLYKWGQKHIDGYIFTGKKNAKTWVDEGVIPKRKIYETMEGSIKLPKNIRQEKEKNTFLWVGRLIPSKDPLLVLDAFEVYLSSNPSAKLKMVYHTNDLLAIVKRKINASVTLKKSVILLGKLDKITLEKLYLKNEFFITGSHYEGSGYALLESMAYGCIPIITKIPSHEFMTGYGNCGFLYTAKDKEDLLQTLKGLKNIAAKSEREKVYKQFENRLSFEAIADDIYNIFQNISKKRACE